jgi:dipeptidase E
MKKKLIIIAIIGLIVSIAGFTYCSESNEENNPTKLFLASYFADVATLLPEFAGEDLAGKTVVFIPTAGNVETDKTYIDRDKAALIDLGLTVDELDVSTADKEDIKKKLADADMIYVEGGNTFFLLQELKRTGTDELIKEQIKKGKLYIGCSAGSIIASKNIEYVGLIDNVELGPELNGDYSALDIVDFYIVPHITTIIFLESTKNAINEYEDKLELKPINDCQVVTVKGEEIKTLTKEGECSPTLNELFP